jgi:uncharacterized protein YdaU (DUF1376 family)
MKIHSYPWYTDDWYGKETWLSMSCEERGIYRELLDHCFEEGSLPDREEVLQKRCGATDKEWKRSSAKPLSKFERIDDRLRHRKVDEIRHKLLDWREQKADAGRRSAEAKRQRKLNDRSNGNIISLQPSTSSTTSSTPYPQADGDEIANIAVAIINRHPHPQKMRMKDFLQAVLSKQQPNENLADVIAEVDRNHRALCDLTVEDGGWKGGQMKYKQIPALRDWVWRSRDPTSAVNAKPTQEERPQEFIG